LATKEFLRIEEENQWKVRVISNKYPALSPEGERFRWKIGEGIPRPHAILVISAQWLTEGTGIDISERPTTLYDFYGFPEELYALKYEAPGAPQYARLTKNIMAPQKIEEERYGLDHGAWVPLLHMYPKADIPVFQLSVDFSKPAQFHYDFGCSLAPLRERGVLILGSGNIVHNLRAINWKQDASPFEWARQFDQYVEKALKRKDVSALVGYTNAGVSASLAVPTPDHYFPLLYALGAAGGSTPVFPVEGIEHGSISMRSVLWS
jgi:4,5-DOPA dioxygenase extradiol